MIRATPGGRQVGVIDLGDTGVRRQAVAPRKIGRYTWWAVETADERQGWVAALYLAPDQPIAPNTLLDLGQRLVAAFGNGDLATEDVSVAYPVLLGDITSPRPIYNALDAPSTWVVTRNIPRPDEGEPTSFADFFGVERWASAELSVGEGYLDPAAESAARSYFGNLPSVVIRSLNPESLLWERVHVFLSHRGAEFSIVGIVREIEPGPTGIVEAEARPNPKPDVGPVDPVDR